MLYERPLGTYEILLEEDTYKVKRIILNPNQQFSLQYHNNRWEEWIIVEGKGIITIDKDERNCIVGDRFHISPKNIHRASAGSEGLVFIEVQRGICDEEDIIRLSDDYGRV